MFKVNGAKCSSRMTFYCKTISNFEFDENWWKKPKISISYKSIKCCWLSLKTWIFFKFFLWLLLMFFSIHCNEMYVLSNNVKLSNNNLFIFIDLKKLNWVSQVDATMLYYALLLHCFIIFFHWLDSRVINNKGQKFQNESALQFIYTILYFCY